jgi:phenylpyruvate tautomerase PptA (4-oxalocrotonate tautomerase family)
LPTYICFAQPDTISPEQREDLAGAITDAHSRATGAPVSFTQVIFRDLAPDGHFIGGRAAAPTSLRVHGSIRDGRPSSIKAELLTSLRDLIERITGVDRENIWVYVSELPAPQMVEFGEVLPASGDEDRWMAELPTDLRDRLQAFETNE